MVAISKFSAQTFQTYFKTMPKDFLDKKLFGYGTCVINSKSLIRVHINRAASFLNAKVLMALRSRNQLVLNWFSRTFAVYNA